MAAAALENTEDHVDELDDDEEENEEPFPPSPPPSNAGKEANNEVNSNKSAFSRHRRASRGVSWSSTAGEETGKRRCGTTPCKAIRLAAVCRP